MKKLLIISITVGVIIFGGLFVLQNVNLNRIGTDEYYTQIEGPGKKIEEEDENGKKFILLYEYKLPAYDKDGQKKTLTFTAQKQLREKAYLDLYAKNGNVKSYQEVKLAEIPEKAKEKLK